MPLNDSCATAAAVIVYPKSIPVERAFALRHAQNVQSPLPDAERAALLRWRAERALNERRTACRSGDAEATRATSQEQHDQSPTNDNTAAMTAESDADRYIQRVLRGGGGSRSQGSAPVSALTRTIDGGLTTASPQRCLAPIPPRAQPVSLTRVKDFLHREEITRTMVSAHRNRVLSSMSYFDSKHRHELELLQREAEQTRLRMSSLRQRREGDAVDPSHCSGAVVGGGADAVHASAACTTLRPVGPLETVAWGSSERPKHVAASHASPPPPPPPLLSVAAQHQRLPVFAVRFPLEEAVKRKFCKAPQSEAAERKERAQARAYRAEREATELLAKESRRSGLPPDLLWDDPDEDRHVAASAPGTDEPVQSSARTGRTSGTTRRARKAAPTHVAPVLSPTAVQEVDRLCRLRGFNAKMVPTHAERHRDGCGRVALRKVPEFNYWDSVDSMMRLRDERHKNLRDSR